MYLFISLSLERERQREDYTHLYMFLYGYISLMAISLYIYIERDTDREIIHTSAYLSIYNGVFYMGYVWHMHAICREYAWNMCGNVRDIYVWGMYGVRMQYSVLSLPRPLFKQQQTPKSEQFEEGLKRV